MIQNNSNQQKLSASKIKPSYIIKPNNVDYKVNLIPPIDSITTNDTYNNKTTNASVNTDYTFNN